MLPSAWFAVSGKLDEDDAGSIVDIFLFEKRRSLFLFYFQRPKKEMYCVWLEQIDHQYRGEKKGEEKSWDIQGHSIYEKKKTRILGNSRTKHERKEGL